MTSPSPRWSPSDDDLPDENWPTNRKLRLRRGGRNMHGKRVLIATCGCGWQHMTAYPFLRRRGAVDYLCGRFNAHPCSPSPVADPRALGAHDCPRCGEPYSFDGCGCFPDDSWPPPARWHHYLAVAFFIAALVIGVTVHGIG